MMDNIIQKYETTETSTSVSSEIVDSGADVSTVITVDGMSKADIAKKYNLSAAEKAALNKVDLIKKMPDGLPKYIIVGRNNGSGPYQVCENLGKKKNGYNDLKIVSSGQVISRKLMDVKDVSGKTTATQTTTTTTQNYDIVRTTTTNTKEDVLYRMFDGVKDWTINSGDGVVTGKITARDGEINFNYGEVCDNSQVNQIEVTGGYVTRDVLNSISTSTFYDKKLQQALASKGIKLGFISDNNNTTVEDLYGVSKINVGRYSGVDFDASADVQNQMSGTFTGENGVTYRIDDVWFKS